MSVAHMHLLLHGLVNGDTCHCFEAIGSADMNTESNRSLNLKVANKKCNLHCLEYAGQVCGGASGKVAVYESQS